MNSIDDIPREHLVSMLLDKAWWSAQRDEFGMQGYSFDTDEGTAIRDVVYRSEPLFDTREHALLAHWQRHYLPEQIKPFGDPDDSQAGGSCT